MPNDFKNLSNEEQRDFEFLRVRQLGQLAALLIEERGLNFSTAFSELYNSKTYEKLSNPQTGLYFQSPHYIYDYLEHELNTGEIN